MIERNLEVACIFYGGRWISVSTLWYLYWLATFKLFTALDPNRFLQIDHEWASKILHWSLIGVNFLDILSLILGKANMTISYLFFSAFRIHLILTWIRILGSTFGKVDPDPRIHLSVIVDPDPLIHFWKKWIRIRFQVDPDPVPSGSGSEYLFSYFS